MTWILVPALENLPEWAHDHILQVELRLPSVCLHDLQLVYGAADQ